MSGLDWSCLARTVMSGQVSHGLVMFGLVSHGQVSHGQARQGHTWPNSASQYQSEYQYTSYVNRCPVPRKCVQTMSSHIYSFIYNYPAGSLYPSFDEPNENNDKYVKSVKVEPGRRDGDRQYVSTLPDGQIVSNVQYVRCLGRCMCRAWPVVYPVRPCLPCIPDRCIFLTGVYMSGCICLAGCTCPAVYVWPAVNVRLYMPVWPYMTVWPYMYLSGRI